MNDDKLNKIVKKAIQGESRAFAKLCEYKGQHILYLCVKIMGNFHDGEDAAQEILLIMQRDISKLQNPEAFTTWLYRLIVRNCGKMKKKLQLRSAVPIDHYADSVGESREEFLPQSFTESEFNKKLLLECIDNLPEDCRVCLLLYYYEGLKYTQIAHALSITTNDVGNLLVKARKLLRKGLEGKVPLNTPKGFFAVVGTPVLSAILQEEAFNLVPKAAVRQLCKNAGIAGFGRFISGKSVAGSLAVITLASVGMATIFLAKPAPVVAFPPPVVVSSAPSSLAQPPLQIRTLDDMLGEEDANVLRAFAREENVLAEETAPFFERIGLVQEFEGRDAATQTHYRFYRLYKADKLLMVIERHETGGATAVAFRFTDSSEALLKHVETYLYFDAWKEQAENY